MKKPADPLCQRAALPIALGVLSIRPLTRHPEVELIMMVVVCQCAQHKFKDYRFRPELSIPNVICSSPPPATSSRPLQRVGGIQDCCRVLRREARIATGDSSLNTRREGRSYLRKTRSGELNVMGHLSGRRLIVK
jgi:hypothetical protein